MMGFHLTGHASLLLRAGVWLGAGALIGAFYFLSLHWNVRMLAFGRPLLRGAQEAVGTINTVAGKGFGFSGDGGPAASAQFSSPNGLACRAPRSVRSNAR